MMPPAQPNPPSYWSTWGMLALFVFLGFECTLLAVALKGSWFVLLAPGAVCSLKAWDTWRILRRAAGDG
jgi:hypothetical protein